MAVSRLQSFDDLIGHESAPISADEPKDKPEQSLSALPGL
jgi:hypothetical protein